MHLARIALATLLVACSRSALDGGAPGPLPKPLECHAPRTLACSQLVVLSSDVALDGQVPIDYLEWREDHFVAVGDFASARSLVVSGVPPTLHVGANESFALTGGSGIETVRAASANGVDQTILTTTPEHDQAALHFYDATDAPRATYDLSNVSNTAHVASYDNLVLFAYELDTYDHARVGVVDDTGTLVREEPLGRHLAQAWGLPGAYGCGFFYAPLPAPTVEYVPTLVVMPIDGELETQVEIPRVWDTTFDAWPYDERAIAMTWVEQSLVGECTVHLHVVRDDGAVLVNRSYASNCDAPPAPYATTPPTRLLVTRFGAVLRMPDWTMQLLDEAANEVGTPVAIAVGDASTEHTLFEAAGDGYIAAITAANGAAPHATLIGCQ
jgi:hypothetical protein